MSGRARGSPRPRLDCVSTSCPDLDERRSGVTSVTVRDEALAGSTPRLRPAADRDRVTSVLDEQHNGPLGIGVALAEHRHRQPHVRQHPAGMKPIDRNMRRTRDVPKLELRTIADVDDHVITERRGEIVGLNRSTSLQRVHTRIVTDQPGAAGGSFGPQAPCHPRRRGRSLASLTSDVGRRSVDERPRLLWRPSPGLEPVRLRWPDGPTAGALRCLSPRHEPVPQGRAGVVGRTVDEHDRRDASG